MSTYLSLRLGIGYLCKQQIRQSPIFILSENFNLFSGYMKDKNTAWILAIFLWGIWLHKFYLGQPIIGVVYILFCWTFIPAIIAFFEWLGYFMCKNNEVFNKKYNAKEVLMEKALRRAINPDATTKQSVTSYLDELKKLKELLDIWAITQDEFDEGKLKIMNNKDISNTKQEAVQSYDEFWDPVIKIDTSNISWIPKKKKLTFFRGFRILFSVIFFIIWVTWLIQHTQGSLMLFFAFILLPFVWDFIRVAHLKIFAEEIQDRAIGLILITFMFAFWAFSYWLNM